MTLCDLATLHPYVSRLSGSQRQSDRSAYGAVQTRPTPRTPPTRSTLRHSTLRHAQTRPTRHASHLSNHPLRHGQTPPTPPTPVSIDTAPTVLCWASRSALRRGRAEREAQHSTLRSSCSKCGQNGHARPNCCSPGGAWEGLCGDGGLHTWHEEYMACNTALPAAVGRLTAPGLQNPTSRVFQLAA